MLESHVSSIFNERKLVKFFQSLFGFYQMLGIQNGLKNLSHPNILPKLAYLVLLLKLFFAWIKT